MTATILLTIVCPGLGFIVGYYCLTSEYFDWRSAAFCIALFFASLTYCYNTTEPSDIVRYIAFAEEMGKKPFSEAFTGAIHGDEGLWLFSFVSWIAGKLGNPRLLPASSTFIVYYIGLFITGKLGENIGTNRQDITAYMLTISMALSFYSIANNVRNVCSFAIVGLAVFRDVYEKKKDWKTVALYILPVYIHSSAVAIIACRLSILIISKFRFVGLVSCASMNLIVNYLYSITSKINSSNSIVSLLVSLIKKTYYYFNDTSSRWGLVVKNSGSSQLQRFLTILFAVLMCIIAFWDTKYLKFKMYDENNREYYQRISGVLDFIFVIGLLTISCLPVLTPEYWRFGALLILMGSPVYFVHRMSLEDSDYEEDIIITSVLEIVQKLIILIIIGLFLIWIRNLYLYVDIGILLLQPFICSPIVVFVRSVFIKAFMQ